MTMTQYVLGSTSISWYLFCSLSSGCYSRSIVSWCLKNNTHLFFPVLKAKGAHDQDVCKLSAEGLLLPHSTVLLCPNVLQRTNDLP